MIKSFIALTFILASNLAALDMVSLNFHNLSDDGSWAYDSQTIKSNEKAGTPDYPGGSTITNQWNNILAGTVDKKVGLEDNVNGKSIILDSDGKDAKIDVKIKSLSPTWNNAYRNKPGMVGVSAWPRMRVKDAISLEGINKYASKYDVIFHMSYQKDSGFTSGVLDVGTNKILFTRENTVIIIENLTDDQLAVSLTNKSSGVDKGGVFIGGIQIIKK